MGKRYRYTGPNRSSPGRTRQRLAKVLMRDLQLIVDPEDLIISHIRNCGPALEVCRWECFGHDKGQPPGARRSYYSFSTMTECVKHGVVLIGDDQIEANF